MNHVCLPDATRHEGFLLQWEAAGLSPESTVYLAKAHEAIHALRGIDELLESDEFLSDKDNQGTFDYTGLTYDMRWRLRCARKILHREIEHNINRLYKEMCANPVVYKS